MTCLIGIFARAASSTPSVSFASAPAANMHASRDAASGSAATGVLHVGGVNAPASPPSAFAAPPSSPLGAEAVDLDEQAASGASAMGAVRASARRRSGRAGRMGAPYLAWASRVARRSWLAHIGAERVSQRSRARHTDATMGTRDYCSMQ